MITRVRAGRGLASPDVFPAHSSRPGVGFVKALQVRLAVRRPADIGHSCWRSRGRAGAGGGHRRRRRGSIARIPGSLLTRERAVRLFGFRLADVLEKPVPIRAPVQSDADGPRLREDFRILDGRFVLNRVGVGHAVSLDHVERVAVKIARHVEPGFVVVVGDVHHQRVAVPSAARIAHPGIDVGGVRAAVGVDQAIDQRPLERDGDGARASGRSETENPDT